MAAPLSGLATVRFSSTSASLCIRMQASLLVLVVGLSSPLFAQKEAGYGRSYVIEADAAWISPGEVVAPAFLSIQDGIVERVSRQQPRGGGPTLLGLGGGGAKVLKVQGTLAPGLVDAWSGLTPSAIGSSRNQPIWAVVSDGLPLDIEGSAPSLSANVLAARTAGVAAVFLGNPASQLRRGSGTPALFSSRHLPRPEGFVALEFALGSARDMGVSGFLQGDELAEVFQEAVDWRDSLDEHAEKVEKYEKDLKAYQKKLDEFVKEQKKASEDAAGAAQSGESGGGPKEDGEKAAAMPKRPKRPKAPASRTARDQILEAINGDSQVRVYADTVADIRAALALGTKHHLDLVVVGAFEADIVAEELAEAGIPIVLSVFEWGVGDRSLIERWNRLQSAKVEVALSSGGVPNGHAGLLLRAGELIAAGADVDEVWAALTTVPARLLGLSRRAGRLVDGATASVILFEGSSPFDASATFRSHIPK